uniref:NADH-ubiquinone oxidoreductase chain 3 n=1 Tax=Hunterella nodulosa TaxID=108243 RepID=H9YU40_9CEST|nr:NADH dehydrogenase subunit 3 [Hunterella nodulosa]
MGVVIGILFVFSLLCLIVGCDCSFILGRGVTPVSGWAGSYECGFTSSSSSFNSFGFSYFSLLVFFVIFDLEVSLLLNMPYQGTLFTNFTFYFIFLFILGLGFILEVFWGYVRWGF